MSGSASPRRILVIGGSGYIGSHLARRFAERGASVRILVRSLSIDGSEPAHATGGGMQNIPALRALLRESDVVVHAASATTPGVSSKSPTLEAQGNIAPTLVLLEELQACPGVHLVYLSSGGAVYGNPGADPVREDSRLMPLSNYAAGKAAVEGFLHAFRSTHPNRVTIVRPSNVYGPGQPRYQGFAVVRTMLQHVLDGSCMEIWGDGSSVRDFVYLDDVLDAVERIVDSPGAGGVYNVGSGEGHSLLELRTIIEQATRRRLDVRYVPARSMDVRRIVLDSGAMLRDFGWCAEVPLAAGVERTWQWLTRIS